MKTAREKAEFWIRYHLDFESTGLTNALEKLLREQDRDTRHACAKEIDKLAMDHDTICACLKAIVNTKAV